MVEKTRLSTTRPNREEHLENATRRCRVKKSIEKAQQEEDLKELLKIMANNGEEVPYGKVDKLVKLLIHDWREEPSLLALKHKEQYQILEKSQFAMIMILVLLRVQMFKMPEVERKAQQKMQ